MSWVWHHKKANTKEPDWNAPIPDTGAARLEYLYAWERRCRGYAIHPYPVAIEPPFVPYEPDDPQAPLRLTHSLPWAGSHTLRHLSLHFPLDQKVTTGVTASFLSSLQGMHYPIAFEIVAGKEEIGYQLTAAHGEADGVLAGAQMHWPRAQIEESDDLLANKLRACLGHSDSAEIDSFVADFGLLHFAYLPVLCFESFAADPLAGVLAGLGALEEGEMAALQVLFTPAHRRWNEALLQVAKEFGDDDAALHNQGRGSQKYFPESEMMRAARAKLGHPLFAVTLRVFALSIEGQHRAFTLCRKIGGALGIFTNPQANASGPGNGMIALSNSDPHAPHPYNVYPDEAHIEDVFERRSHRAGMLLSLPELVGFVHPPAETLQHPRLVRLDPHAHSLPDHLLDAEGALIGIHRYRSQNQELVWPDAYRNRHAYILGATRMGKSTLLLNLIAQDMAAGRGLCLIDPHGDLALDVLSQVPPERAGDVLYLDLSDRDYPLSLGLLEASSEHEQRLLCSDVLSVLKRLFASSWGDRLEHILRHAILTLLSVSGSGSSYSKKTYTLRDIRPLLSNKEFREQVVQQLDDPDLKGFWTGEFFGYSSSHFAPLYNKLGLLLSSPIVRNIIAQRQSKLSFAHVISSRQVLLINLASSRIGNDNAHFLGALLVSKLQIAAMQSLRLGQNERTPFTLYVDEFQNFVVSSFETILSEAGKAGLSLVMANQFLEQLNAHLQTAILSNAGTLVSFRVSSDSGRLLEKEFAGRFKSSDLVSLNRGQAVARIGSAQDSFAIETLPPLIQPSMSFAATILEQSRTQVCRLRHEVEAELAEETARQAAMQEAARRTEEEKKRAGGEKKQTEKQAEAARKAEEKAKARRDSEGKKTEVKKTEVKEPVKPAQIKSAQTKPAVTTHIEDKQSSEKSTAEADEAIEGGVTDSGKQGIEKRNIEKRHIAPTSGSAGASGSDKGSSVVPEKGAVVEEVTISRAKKMEEETLIIGPAEPECFGVPDE
jgi:hypothetical protein